MGRKDNPPLPTLSPAAADELTAQGDPDPPPAAAGNALQKARNFIGLGHTKKANVSMEQKQMMALMMADTGAIETTYKDTDSQFDKLDERELAKTLGEEHLDMSVVATIVQDRDRFEKIAPQIREKIMIFILKERLKGRYFLLVDTDHLRVPGREGALFYKRIRRSIFYALLFLLLGIVWLRWLDGDMVTFEYRDKRPDMPTTKYLTDTITAKLLNETSAYMRNVYIWKLHEEGSHPQCKLKFMSTWSKWKEDQPYVIGNPLPTNCGLRQYVRHRIVLIERKTSRTNPRTSNFKCPHSHEIQFNFETCCAPKITPSLIKDDTCTVQVDVPLDGTGPQVVEVIETLDNMCNGKTQLKVKDSASIPHLTGQKITVLIYSGYKAKRNSQTGKYDMLENGFNPKNFELHQSNVATTPCEDAFLVFELSSGNPPKPYLLCDSNNNNVNNDKVISVMCQFPLPDARSFKELVLSSMATSIEYDKDWSLFEEQNSYFSR